VTGGARTERPEELSIRFSDRLVVDVGEAPAHQAVLPEFPVLVAIGTEVDSALVMPLMGEANRDAVVREGPDLLDQSVVDLLGPALEIE
jgi:hypothetical protein